MEWHKLGAGFSKNKKGQISKKADLSSLVGLPGFEPRLTESKSVVLPLHHNPIIFLAHAQNWDAKIRFRGFSAKRFFGYLAKRKKGKCKTKPTIPIKVFCWY
jgi:hypothetical protein